MTRKFLTEDGRILGKVSVVDIAVFLLVVAVGLFAYLHFVDKETTRVTARVVYTVTSVLNESAEQVKLGDRVRDSTGSDLGVVRAVEVKPARLENVTPSGELKVFDSSMYSKISIVLEGQAEKLPASLRMGAQHLRVGRSVTLVGPTWEFTSTITAVDVIN